MVIQDEVATTYHHTDLGRGTGILTRVPARTLEQRNRRRAPQHDVSCLRVRNDLLQIGSLDVVIELDYLAGRVDEVPRDQEIIVICNSGNRSQVARDILLNAGFENVTSIAGGIQGWMSAGYDFVTGE